MKHNLFWLFIFCIVSKTYSQTTIIDAETAYPVSYATVSFGDGQGLFADNDGMFIFTKKLYPDVDSLYISALGYKAISLSTSVKKSEKIIRTKILGECAWSEI